jgi:hypothetical protein
LPYAQKHTTPAIWEIKFDSLGAFAGKGKKSLKRLASMLLCSVEDGKKGQKKPASTRKASTVQMAPP